MKARAVRAAPFVLFATLAGWTALDLIRFASPAAWVVGGAVLAIATLGALPGRAGLVGHRASRAFLAVVFIVERLLVAGIDVVPMIAFLALAMCLASLQGLGRTFGPVYDAVPDATLVAKVDAAAIGAYARALGFFGFTFVTSLLLLSVIPLAAVPGRNLALVLGLALVLLAVIAWLAVSPSLPAKRRA